MQTTGLSTLCSFLPAGATNVLTTTPLWVVNTRLKLQGVGRSARHGTSDEQDAHKPYAGITGTPVLARQLVWELFSETSTGQISRIRHQRERHGISATLRRIAREEGVASLWSGVTPSLVLALNPAVQWAVYEALKRYLQRRLGVKVGSANMGPSGSQKHIDDSMETQFNATSSIP